MSTESIRGMSAEDSLLCLTSACVLATILADLQEEGKLKDCRVVLGSLWKTATTEASKLTERNAAELVVDQFFVQDGDMVKGKKLLIEQLQGCCRGLPEIWQLMQGAIDMRVAREKVSLAKAFPEMVKMLEGCRE